MEEDTEYVKLPVEDRCVHKLWRARVHGYEELAKLFRSIDDEKSPEFNKYLGLIKKFAIDSNAVAQEKGLEAVLAYVENSGVAGKTVGDVMSGVITKCIAAPKTKTKELAVQIALMYIEIEQADAVQEELLKGMEHKNPKIVAACVSAISQALREFGPKVVNVKPLIKKMPVLLEDEDKGVREEGKAMVVEIYKWIGDSLQSQLSSLKPVQVTELEAKFEKVKGEKVTPIRFLKSQQQKQAKLAAEAAAGDAEDARTEYLQLRVAYLVMLTVANGPGSNSITEANFGTGRLAKLLNQLDELEDEDNDAAEIESYELEPVSILSKLPKDFFEKLEAKKWQERKEAVDTLEQLLQNAEKLESGDYRGVVYALKKIKESCDKAVIVAKVPKSEHPTTAPAKMGRTDAESGAKPSAGSTVPKPVKRPTSASSQSGNARKKPPAKKAGGAGSAGGPKAKAATKTAKKDLSSEEVDERASTIFPEDVLSGLGDANWKTRLSAVEQFTQIVSEMEPNDVPTQVLIRTLNKKPGLKDTNFQVLTARLEAVKLMAETTPFSSMQGNLHLHLLEARQERLMKAVKRKRRKVLKQL